MAEIKPDIPKKRREFPTFVDIVMLFVMFLFGGLWGTFTCLPYLVEKFGLTSCMDSPLSKMIVYGASMTWALIFMLIYRRVRGARGGVLRYRLKWFNGWLVLVGLVGIAAIGIVEEPLWQMVKIQDVDALIGFGKWAIINTVILAPIFEEAIFRGVVLESVRSRWGNLWAVVVSSLLFGLAHQLPQQIINAFAVGLLLGTIYIATDSLLTVIILHAINNALSYMLMTVFNTGEMTLRSMIDSDVAYWTIYAVSCVVTVLCAAITISVARKRKNNNKPPQTDVE
ncbi:MAG: CPBP family intramembrane metalloprotease [Rikenellaceae bacterium]|nr:CPBP family intramembrane metalloprotease [Rikenellaceae bacterium]